MRMNAASGKYPKAQKLVMKGSRPVGRAAKLRKAVAKKPRLVEVKASLAQRKAGAAALKADPGLKNVKLTPRQTYAMEAKENAKGIG